MNRCTLPFDGKLGFQLNGEKLEKKTLDIRAENLFNALLAFSFIYNQDIMLTTLHVNGHALTSCTDAEMKDNYELLKRLYRSSYIGNDNSYGNRFVDSEPTLMSTPMKIVQRSDGTFYANVGRIFKDAIVEPDGRVSIITHADSSKDDDIDVFIMIDMLKEMKDVLETSRFGKDPDTVFTVESKGTLISRKADFKLSDISELIEVLEGSKADCTKPNDIITMERNTLMQNAFARLKNDMPREQRMACADIVIGRDTNAIHVIDRFNERIDSYAFFDSIRKIFGNDLLYKIREFIETAEETGCFYEPMKFIKYKLIS
jgi:hypothetical protein